MASLFDTLQANAFRAGVQARTKQSRDWFKKEDWRQVGNPSKKCGEA